MGAASAVGEDQIQRQPLDTWLSDSFTSGLTPALV